MDVSGEEEDGEDGEDGDVERWMHAVCVSSHFLTLSLLRWKIDRLEPVVMLMDGCRDAGAGLDTHTYIRTYKHPIDNAKPYAEYRFS